MPNDHTIASIISSLSNSTSNNSDKPRTELDSHANMAVLGKDCFVFEQTGRFCDVSAFSPSIETTSLPIVDAVIVYDCPYTLTLYLLMIRNALYVKDMSNNLLPPFLLREAQIEVNECPKIHAISVDENVHSIFFPLTELRIPLKLHGIFSFFYHRTPVWNPHSTHNAHDEEAFIDNNSLNVD